MSSVIERRAESPGSQGSRTTDLLAKRLYYIEMYGSQRSQTTAVNRSQLQQLVSCHLANLAELELVRAVCRVEVKNNVYSRLTSNGQWVNFARVASHNVSGLLQSILASTVHRGSRP